ncbi:pyridoxal phosphate-dependent transferase [Fusarium acuminatum]|uniref:Pyridoxal phosphate-dependent transferase n=1 Tax=Fusarium acuminatum TaxID=5515 RepID=A0ABZ2X663_9HYPO
MVPYIGNDSIADNGLSRRHEISELLQQVDSITTRAFHTSNGSPKSDYRDDKKPIKRYEELFSGFSAEGLGSSGFKDAIDLLSRNSVDNASPGFLGKLVSAPSAPGIAADLFLSILNNNGHVQRAGPALTAVEKHVSLELARLFGLQGPHAGGVTVPGGAAGNLMAMLVARNIIAPESKQRGLTPGEYAVFVSEAAHYSVSNSANVIGLGNDSIISVPALQDGTMDVNALESAVEQAARDGKKPLLIAATSGSTVNGAFDSLDKIGAIAHRVGAWFHVDACWGGGVVFSDKLKHLMNGSHLADSIAFNPHKLLGVPLVCAFLLVNDLRTLWLANKQNAGYLFHDHTSKNGTGSEHTSTVDQNRQKKDWRNSKLLDTTPDVREINDLASLTIQCSRRHDATKMFLHWLYYGTAGIAREVEQAVDSAKHLARLVRDHPRFELIWEPEQVFAQVCFYWKSASTADASGQALAEINSSNTRALYQGIEQMGWKVDFAPGKAKGQFLRIACNRLTTRQTVERIVSELVELGESLGL